MTIKRRKPETRTTAKSEPARKVDPKKVMTGVVRSSYMRVLSLTEGKNGKSACSTGIIIPKSDKKTVNAIRKAVDTAARERFGDNVDIFKSQKLKNPFKDGDVLLEDPETTLGNEIADSYFLNAKSYRLPQVVDKYAKKITDNAELHEVCVSGFWYRFSLFFTGYEAITEEGAKIRGVMCMLNNIMFVKEGERLDGNSDAEDDFKEYASEEDEDEDDEYEDDDE